nr:hypothetical protein [Tanacetum cinerariifolium]
GAPLSPDYIPGPEAPPSPDYIPGPEYQEYLPSADDMLPAKEQPLPAAVSPTAESPRYITETLLGRRDCSYTTTIWISYCCMDIYLTPYTYAIPQIRPTLTIAESRRADGKLIGRLRREWRYFRIVATHYVQEVAHSRDYYARIMDYC